MSLVLIGFCLLAASECEGGSLPLTTIENGFDVGCYVFVDSIPVTPIGPGSSYGSQGVFTPPQDKAETTYTLEVFEFLPGQGGIPGWKDSFGNRIYGARGQRLLAGTLRWSQVKGTKVLRISPEGLRVITPSTRD